MNFRKSLPLSHHNLQRHVRTEAWPQHHHLQCREQNDPPSAGALEAIRGLPSARKDVARVHYKGRFAPRLCEAGVGGVDLCREKEWGSVGLLLQHCSSSTFFSSPFSFLPFFCCWWKRGLENKVPVFKIEAFGSLRFDLCTRTLFSHLGMLLLPLLAQYGCGKPKGRWDCDHFPMGMHVLAVDDNSICLKVLENLLCKCQYHSFKIKKTKIDDVEMPVLMWLVTRRDDVTLCLSHHHLTDADGRY